jgi:hypothetical protein
MYSRHKCDVSESPYKKDVLSFFKINFLSKVNRWNGRFAKVRPLQQSCPLSADGLVFGDRCGVYPREGRLCVNCGIFSGLDWLLGDWPATRDQSNSNYYWATTLSKLQSGKGPLYCVCRYTVYCSTLRERWNIIWPRLGDWGVRRKQCNYWATIRFKLRSAVGWLGVCG